MKKYILLILIFLMALLTDMQGETLQKNFSVQKGQNLEIFLKSGGSLMITGWKKNQVAVTVDYKKGQPTAGDFSFEQTPAGIQIESPYSASVGDNGEGLTVQIKVPSTFDIWLRTSNGNVTVRNVQGTIKGKTMNGDLDLEGLKGEINLKTMSGDAVLKNSHVDGKLKSLGGRVSMINVTGGVDGDSLGGNVIYRNAEKQGGEGRSGEVIRIKAMGGDINVNDAPKGADVHTMGGGIHIKSAGEFVKAKTMGGDITILQVDGWVTAQTMGGKVEVTMVGDPAKGKRDVLLSTIGNDVILNVPANLSMDVEVLLAVTEDARREFKIQSDFPLDIKKDEKWDYTKGDPRKCIRGTGKTGGGTHKIKLKTTNGNVYLKKNS